MARLHGLALLFVPLLGFACGETDIPDTPLAGIIGGEAWTMKTAHTDSFLSDEDSFFISAFEQSFEACASEPSDDPNQVIFTLPTATGSGDFDLLGGISLTFVVREDDGLNNLIATEGAYVIESVTDTQVVGKVLARFDDGNEVSGRFEARICPKGR